MALQIWVRRAACCQVQHKHGIVSASCGKTEHQTFWNEPHELSNTRRYNSTSKQLWDRARTTWYSSPDDTGQRRSQVAKGCLVLRLYRYSCQLAHTPAVTYRVAQLA